MNHGKSVIGVRLLLLKDYLQANTGRDRYVRRSELEAYLASKGYAVEKKTLYTDFAIASRSLLVRESNGAEMSRCREIPFRCE
ncbi:MAG: hypothetical protein E7554_06645 [Ruminococcaceae bacterium]|nr:hypothetical protein [Oscillospiraceae bacterium]